MEHQKSKLWIMMKNCCILVVLEVVVQEEKTAVLQAYAIFSAIANLVHMSHLQNMLA